MFRRVVYVMRWLRAVLAMEDQIIRIARKLKEVTMDLTKLQNAVAANTSAIESALVLIQGLADAIHNAPDQASVDALADQISAEADKLAAAVVANTPSASA